MLLAAQIRETFLSFFKSKQHLIVPSAPVVLKNDPTLKFTNSGMNQFKDYFLGNGTPPANRIADTQKCLRVSGKHNDLEEVGVDTYHHTFFEMLGNWSFGDYFKTEAIAWSWELLTDVYGLDKDRLYVTYFEGDTGDKLAPDTEAYKEWQKYVNDDRILPGNKKDNFWEMGDTGPCGPCSEIHIDMRSDAERAQVAGHQLVNKDHPQVIEIWNNVFMAFNRKKDGSLELLPQCHVDTGMGFERLVRALQGKSSNYDTDLFIPTIQLIEQITQQQYNGGASLQDVAFRVIADHIRAICFAIADGQLPGNTEAAYVIRRILRRAVRYYYSYLNYKQPLLYQLVQLKATEFATVFPELKAQEAFVSKIILEEENSFLRTLEGGLKRLDDVMAESNIIIDGGKAFELYDTYGFPIDLTQIIAAEKGLSIDTIGFEQALGEQKNRSRAATTIDVQDWVILQDAPSEFVGYTQLSTSTSITKYRKVNTKGKELYQIVLASTPFYAESGGQIGDTGTITVADTVIEIIDTKKENDMIVHFATSIPSNLSGTASAQVDALRRSEITTHHTATHLLQAALQQVVGKHVAQKGSLNGQYSLRFDFSHFAKLSPQELQQVEDIVNEKIRANIPVSISVLPKEEALALGAMALFGEKYGDVVRVVIIDPNYSIELCGGTHVGSTGELGNFKITSEGAIAAGVRRIEAVCGKAAQHYINEELQQLQAIKEVFKNPKDLLKAITTLADDKSKLQKTIEQLEAKQIADLSKQLANDTTVSKGITILAKQVQVSSTDGLRKLATDVKALLPAAHYIILTAVIDGKAGVAIALDDSTATLLNAQAPQLIKQHVAPLIKGGGGGQALLATAGGQDASQLGKVQDVLLALLN
jgi:alanyl-tRNA synthetase